MIRQIPLNVQPRLPYDRNGFVIHSGVKESWLSVLHAVQANQFFCCLFYGRARFGKTHTAVALFSEVVDSLKKAGRFVDGNEFSAFVEQYLASPKGEGDVVVVDDFDYYARTVEEGDSGPFVAFYESLRHRKGSLFLFLNPESGPYHYDQHMRSRMNASSHYTIEAPTEEDLPALISALARQRGVKLSERKLSYLTPRIRREVPALEGYFDRMLHLSSLRSNKIGFSELADAL